MGLFEALDSEKGGVVSVEAMREVLAELTSGADGAEWSDTRVIQKVLRRVVMATLNRHAVLLPEETVGDAWDKTVADVTDGEGAGELRLEDEGSTPVLFTPKRLVMVTTRHGPLLHLQLEEVARTPGAESGDGFCETLAEGEPGQTFRLVGGAALVVPHGFNDGRVLRLPGRAWWQLLQCSPDALRARLQ